MRFPAKDPSYYGSLYSQSFAYYLTILTKERTETLKEWIEGTEEGDVCSGSVRINY